MSKNFSTHVTKAVGAAAMLSTGAIANAQVPASTVRRDSVETRRVIVLQGLQGRMDSVTVMVNKIAQERYGSQAWIELAAHLDSFMANSVGLAVRQGFAGARPVMVRALPMAKGWLGLNAQGPTLVISDSAGTRRTRFLAYQPILSVDPGSPADHAGIEPGDLLVAYNGVDLINHEFNLSDLIAPKKRVDVTVRRGAELKDFALTVANPPDEVVRRRMDMNKFRFEIPAQGGTWIAGDGGFGAGDGARPVTIEAGGRAARGFGGSVRVVPSMKGSFFLSPNGLFGAGLSNVGEDLARILQLPKSIRKGVLVNEVPEETPAYRAGLHVGDVIIAADDDSVSSVGQLRDLMLARFANRSAEIQVVRQQKVKKLTVSWQE